MIFILIFNKLHCFFVIKCAQIRIVGCHDFRFPIPEDLNNRVGLYIRIAVIVAIQHAIKRIEALLIRMMVSLFIS